jgi:seryl-tRNA synthetase
MQTGESSPIWKSDLEDQNIWLEVSSRGNFTDWQVRQTETKSRSKVDGKLRHLSTLNVSGLAIPRLFGALLENNLQGNCLLQVPAVLVEYFGKEYLKF